MDFSTGRLEGSARIQDRPFSNSFEEQKRIGPRRNKEQARKAEADDLPDEPENHEFDETA